MSQTRSPGPDGTARWPAVLAWALWVLAMLVVPVMGWFDHLFRQVGRPELVQLKAGNSPYVLAVVSATTVGAVLAGRRPRHPVGWLLLTLGLTIAATGITGFYIPYGLLVRPGSLPAVPLVTMASDNTFVLWPACVGFILLLTPTGTLPTPRWRWWAWLMAAAPVVFLAVAAVSEASLPEPYQSVPNPTYVPALEPLRPVGSTAVIVSQLGVVAGGVSLVMRFRRARGIERQQLGWVAFGAVLSLVAALAVVVGMVLDVEAVFVGAALVYIAALPPIIGAAVLRYRLYDIDRIVSRTIAYALLTLLLGLGYAAVVLTLGQVPGRERSNLAVAAATLAVAAAFQPLRRRIQTLVDRRFNRRRYDAARTIEAFSNRLRQQIDLDALSGELLAVVDQTMQPTWAALWLRPAGRAASREVAP